MRKSIDKILFGGMVLGSLFINNGSYAEEKFRNDIVGQIEINVIKEYKGQDVVFEDENWMLNYKDKYNIVNLVLSGSGGKLYYIDDGGKILQVPENTRKVSVR